MVVLGYLEYVRRRETGDYAKCADDILKEMTKRPMRVIWRAMNRAYHRGFIECGVSIRTGWATQEGIEIVARHAS